MTKPALHALVASIVLLAAAPVWGIGGRVETASGTPVERARVQAYEPGEDHPLAAAVTDAPGRFEGVGHAMEGSFSLRRGERWS